MPPAFGEADDGRTNYNSGFKSKKVSLENIVNGEATPVSWMETLGKGLFRCNKLLGTGSHAVSSVLSMAKKYPRVLVLHEDKLLCCKLDEMELCHYKWLKKLITITNIRRMGRPSFALSSTTEVCVTFDEIDPDTGLIFEEIFSFSKEFEADRFVRDVEDARRAARKARVEAAEARDAAERAGRAAPAGSSGGAASQAQWVPPTQPSKPALPPKPSSPPASGGFGSSPRGSTAGDALFDAFGEFSTAPPPPPPIFSPSLGAPPPPLSMDLFAPSPRTSAAAMPNLLDMPSPLPTPPMYDPYGIAATVRTPGPLNSMTPLAAALPVVPLSPMPPPSPSPAKTKLGEAANKKSNDPFADLTGL